MSVFRIVVRIEMDEASTLRVARLIKEALSPWGVETVTFNEPQFFAHWRPGCDPPVLRAVAEAEHHESGPHGRRVVRR